MHRIVIGILGLLILFLAAVNARLADRERILEQKLALAEQKAKSPRKTAVDELKKIRDEQTQAYRDTIQKIENQTEQSIRQLLDPQQLQKYDAQESSPAVVQLALASVQAPLPAGQSPGYLGVSGADAEGGGAQITQVMRDGVASGSGLQPGDVILEINGEKIADYSALAAKIREAGEGTPVNLRL